MSNVYEIVTQRILERIEETGLLPWKKPWNAFGANIFEPHNFASKKPYNGFNVLLLNSMNYVQPYWLTYRQCQELGGQVKAGEKGCPVIYWKNDNKEIEISDGVTTKKKKLPPLLRYSKVFNVTQCEGIDYEGVTLEDTPEDEKIQAADQILNSYKNGPKVLSEVQRAFYIPSRDIVNMPSLSSFESKEEYYGVLFHELIHSTGHPSRLKREGLNLEIAFGSDIYGKEELIAEIGSSFLCARAGIAPATFDNSVAYLKGWMDRIKADPKMLVQAASEAQKGSRCILGTNEVKE